MVATPERGDGALQKQVFRGDFVGMVLVSFALLWEGRGEGEISRQAIGDFISPHYREFLPVQNAR